MEHASDMRFSVHSGTFSFTPGRLLASVFLILLIFLPRLIDLGTVLTVDEPLWRARGSQFISGLASWNPSMTFAGGQPGVTTMWLAGLADRFQSLAASQAAIGVGVSVLLLLDLALTARLAGPAVALMGGVIIALDPFLIAHSRVVHTDALLGSFMLLTLLTLLLFWKTEARRYLVYAGVATALATLTKLFGLFLLLPAAIIILLAKPRVSGSASTTRRGKGRAIAINLLRFFAPLVLTSLAAWPALLFSPRTPIAFMTQRVQMHSQRAAVGSGGGDPWYYPREFVRRLTPPTSVLLPIVIIGLVAGTGASLPRFPARGPIAALLGSAALYVLALGIAEQKSDRYILIAHLVADLASGAALLWLADCLSRWTKSRSPAFAGGLVRPPSSYGFSGTGEHGEEGEAGASAGVADHQVPRASARGAPPALAITFLTIAGLFLLWDVTRIHPHYMAHWNQLLPVPTDVKLGWGEGLEQAAAYLQEQGVQSPNTQIATYYPGVLSHFLSDASPAKVERFVHYPDPNFHYVILYRSMFGRDQGSYETVAIRKFLGPVPAEGTTVSVDGIPFRLEKLVVVNRIPFVWIFRRLAAA